MYFRKVGWLLVFVIDVEIEVMVFVEKFMKFIFVGFILYLLVCVFM